MKQSLNDLNDYLFDQLDALTNPDLTGDTLKDAVKQGKAVALVSQTIINNANTILKARKHTYETLDKLPQMFNDDEKKTTK